LPVFRHQHLEVGVLSHQAVNDPPVLLLKSGIQDQYRRVQIPEGILYLRRAPHRPGDLAALGIVQGRPGAQPKEGFLQGTTTSIMLSPLYFRSPQPPGST